MRKKKIWYFHHYATPPNMTGLNRPHDFGAKLKREGYSFRVFSASYHHYSDLNVIGDKSLYLVNNDSEIPYIFVNTPTSANKGVKRVFNMLEYYRNLFKVAKKYSLEDGRPDLIIASSPHPLTMVAGIKIANKFNIPCVSEVRDFWPEVFFLGDKLKEKGLIGKALLKGENWIYKKSDAIIFLKAGDTDYLKEKKWTTQQGGNVDLNKCHYINNGVNIDNFNHQINSNILHDEDLDNDKFKVVYVGAIRPVNNVGSILNAAKLLQEKKKIQFIVYGTGNELISLKERVKEEKLTNLVLKGYVEKKYIPYILNKSSVNLLNYSQEKYNWSRGNSSNKLFEYMASGRPIISNVKMGYCLLEKYECGLTVKDYSAESLADDILKVYMMNEKDYTKMSNNARQAAIDFDYSNLSNKLKRVIGNVIK